MCHHWGGSGDGYSSVSSSMYTALQTGPPAERHLQTQPLCRWQHAAVQMRDQPLSSLAPDRSEYRWALITRADVLLAAECH